MIHVRFGRMLLLCAAFGAAWTPAGAVEAAKPDGPCGLVTQAEMRAILHNAVVARPRGQKCIYQAPGAGGYAEIELDRGDAEIAMRAFGGATKIEPGLSDPLAGLGDEAKTMGPAVMVRTGKDLVQIVLSGVADPISAAKRIFKTAKPRI